MDFTLSTFEVQSTQKGEASGVITVRQTGSTRQTPPTGLLGVGQRYLLYLTPSGLSGEQASQFYVTGMNAGIYKAAEGAQTGGETSSGSTFTQADPDPADNLPPHNLATPRGQPSMDGPHRQAIAASRILRLQGLVKLDCMIVVEAGSGCYGSPVGGAPRRRGTR